MWCKRAHTLAHLTKLCSAKVKFKWTDVKNNAFIVMKKIVLCDILLSYPNLIKTFIIYTDASKTQLGGVISQNGKRISFYSCKLTSAQINYTAT